MRLRTTWLLAGAALAVPASAQAATVTVRVEGTQRTLVPERTVHTGSRPVVKDGDPAHSCPADSAAGALERATKGRWDASWSDGLGYFVTGIRGESPSGNRYFTFWLDGRSSQTGLCQATVHDGDSILLYVDDADHPVLPLAVKAPRRARRGARVRVKVTALQPAGGAKAARRVTVLRNGHPAGRTDRHGRLRVRLARRRATILRAEGDGFARSAPVKVAARRAAARDAATARAARSSAPRVHIMVAGATSILRAPTTVRASARRIAVGGRRCTVGAGTPLAALAAARVPYRVRDLGSCSRHAKDASGLYVFQVGSERAHGRDGWVYKVGHRSGTAGAGDPSGPFGAGRLRPGADVLWFWCHMGSGGSCQRTLGTSVRRHGHGIRVTVRAYDDQGRGVRVSRALVHAGGRTARTNGRGQALLRTGRGRVTVTATHPGIVPAFPRRVNVR